MPEYELGLTDEEKDITNKSILAVWRVGWKAGDKHGFDQGFKSGSQTLGHQWFFLATFFILLIGFGFGMAMDLMVSCGPSMVVDGLPRPCGITIFTPDVGWFKNG